MLARLPGCHLALVGEGPARQALERTFAGLPATFVGPLHGEALSAAFASADIFALPSSTETLGLVAIEAMASGVPVVAARRGGLLDVVDDERTGLLYDPDAPGRSARARRRASGGRPRAQRMGAAARDRALAWRWSAATAALRAEYARVLAAEAVDVATATDMPVAD